MRKQRKLKAWVVEDEVTYRNLLMGYIETLGYDVQGFGSGEECLNALNEKPDVIILDHDLGDGIKGFEVLRVVKEHYPGIHVITVSAQQKLSLVTESFHNGSDDYIEKDVACLVRIKIRLERIQRLRELKLKQNRKFISLITGLGIICVVFLLYILWQLGYV